MQPTPQPVINLHHFALEIDKGDFNAELDCLQRLGVEVTDGAAGGRCTFSTPRATFGARVL
jgi:hypothetical protein